MTAEVNRRKRIAREYPGTPLRIISSQSGNGSDISKNGKLVRDVGTRKNQGGIL